MSSVKISILTTRQQVDTAGKPYTVYNVNIKTEENMVFVCERRYNDFKTFYLEWCAVYPTLATRYKLPSKALLFRNSPSVIDKRRNELQNYLREVSEVTCLRPYLCQFLELNESVVKKINPNASRIRYDTMGNMPDKGYNIDLSSEGKRGNTSKASGKAFAAKQDFYLKNKELIDMLLPGGEERIIGLAPSEKNYSQKGIYKSNRGLHTNGGRKFMYKSIKRKYTHSY